MLQGNFINVFCGSFLESNSKLSYFNRLFLSPRLSPSMFSFIYLLLLLTVTKGMVSCFQVWDWFNGILIRYPSVRLLSKIWLHEWMCTPLLSAALLWFHQLRTYLFNSIKQHVTYAIKKIYKKSFAGKVHLLQPAMEKYSYCGIGLIMTATARIWWGLLIYCGCWKHKAHITGLNERSTTSSIWAQQHHLPGIATMGRDCWGAAELDVAGWPCQGWGALAHEQMEVGPNNGTGSGGCLLAEPHNETPWPQCCALFSFGWGPYWISTQESLPLCHCRLDAITLLLG